MKKKKESILHLQKISLSPLIATILLIVVAVAVIGMIVSWGKDFTNQSLLSKDNESIIESSELKGFIYYDDLKRDNLFIKNTSSISGNITKYKINSSLDSSKLNTYITLDEPVPLGANGTFVISLYCVPERNFSVELVTDDNRYVTVPVTNAQMNVSSCDLSVLISSPEDSSTFVLSQDINFSSQISNSLGEYTCSWDSNIDGELSTYCSFTTSSLQEGTHQIILTVEDDFSQETEEITIDIKDNLGAEITYPNNNDTFNHYETITLVGTSINSYGDVTCSWSSNQDGSLGEGCTLENISLSKNSHTITLTVQDDFQTVTDSITLDIGSLSAFILSPLNNSEYIEEDSIFFEESAEYPYQGTHSCSWDSNIDGELSTDCSFTKSDLSLGTHEITLEIDDGLNTDSTSINLIIKEPPCSGLPYIEYSGSDFCIHPTGILFSDNWNNAINYCNSLDSLGFNDWYLPNQFQLQAIWAIGDGTNQGMNQNINKGDYENEWVNLNWTYWTSTMCGSTSSKLINFNNGVSDCYPMYYGHFFRCVRDP